ncbi:BURP domain protein RD22-like [Neltuma alba]|uniref:BURP domain protein RD22-like n=1 Tax=Neltuma alba TaxID=207710 RepID=UPI0010A2D9F8|nr:BURP domain protein RD22-like [Prosopis alba]
MKLPLFSIITAFLTVVMVAAAHDAALAPEIYWKSKLPSTRMPELLKYLLHPTGGGTNNHGVGGMDEMPDISQVVYPKNGYKVYRYDHADKGIPRHNSTNGTVFFLEKDLKAGHKMNLLFTHIYSHASFLPRQVAKSFPFSSTKMAEILNKLAAKHGSVYAKAIKTTIEICEDPGIKGEEKYCATSLESMVDFVTLKLGKNVNALSVEGMKEETKQVEEYTILHGMKKVGETQVVCHKLYYAYAVFLCHKIQNTVAYTVPLEGADGSRMKALCVCHKDTSTWNPKHVSFQLLKVKPGTVPVCHFLSRSTVMWVPK